MVDTPASVVYDLRAMSAEALLFRRALGRSVIKLLRTTWANEPEAPQALPVYAEQLAALDAEVRRRRTCGELDPLPQTVIYAQVADMGEEG
jgi:hypothetical protein